MAADPATVVALEATLGMGPEFPGRRFLAFLDDRPVAASLLLLAGGVAGIYWVATRPEARGRGLGRLVTAYPLCQARDLGYRVAVLQSSQMGYMVYRKLGFDDCCKTSLLMAKHGFAVHQERLTRVVPGHNHKMTARREVFLLELLLPPFVV